jgi:hypothetical protein
VDPSLIISIGFCIGGWGGCQIHPSPPDPHVPWWPDFLLYFGAEDRNIGREEALRMLHQACLFVCKTCRENLVMNVNVAERGYNVAGLYSPIAISRHYVENRLQSLHVDSYAGGTRELSGHPVTSSHRARCPLLTGQKRCASQSSSIIPYFVGQETIK